MEYDHPTPAGDSRKRIFDAVNGKKNQENFSRWIWKWKILSDILKSWWKPLFHDFLFLLRPRPSPLGKNGPNSVNAPPPIDEQPGPEKAKSRFNLFFFFFFPQKTMVFKNSLFQMTEKEKR